MRDEARFWFDMLIFAALVFAIYYLKIQGAESVSPADSVMSLLKIK